MSASRRSLRRAPLRFVRSGVLLVAAAAACFAQPCSAQVRTHGEGGGSFTLAVTSYRDIPFRTVVRQQFDYSCGSAAVATLLRFHYGVSIGEAEVFQRMYERGDQERIRAIGFSMLDMRSYLEARGFHADGLRLPMRELARLGVPAIALIHDGEYRHFVVVKGVEGDRVLVGDPTFGLLTYTRAEFEAVWTGVVLAVRESPPGSPAPAYNRASEWRPWTTASFEDVQQPASPSDLSREFAEIYQITDFIPQ